jgi:hypothetical protein
MESRHGSTRNEYQRRARVARDAVQVAPTGTVNVVDVPLSDNDWPKPVTHAEMGGCFDQRPELLVTGYVERLFLGGTRVA